MATMIERAARAIDPTGWDTFDDYCRLKQYDASELADLRARSGRVQLSLASARRAIAAMREPTPHMYIKGGVAISDVRPQSETYADESSACWTVMIDAALEEKL